MRDVMQEGILADVVELGKTWATIAYYLQVVLVSHFPDR